jgi:hypothetical protein
VHRRTEGATQPAGHRFVLLDNEYPHRGISSEQLFPTISPTSGR